MRRYASSRFRVFVLAGLMVAAALVTTSYAQTTPPAAPAPAAGGAEGGQVIVKSSGGVFGLIITHATDPIFITIALLSVVGLTFILQGFLQNRATVLMPESSTQQIRDLISQKKFKELIEFTETDPSFISRALNPALERAPSFSSMKEAMETAIGEQTAEQFRKIEYLNIIGNLGPLLGLLGTVFGMIQAFQAMQDAGGSATPAQLAGGISTALTHTFLGLMLAVPCLACFGVLRTIVDRLTVRGSLVAEELLLMIKPQESKAPAIARPGMPVAPTPRKAAPVPLPSPILPG